MNRNTWIIIIVLLVIVLLFITYKYMFNKNKAEVSTTVNNDGDLRKFIIPIVNPVDINSVIDSNKKELENNNIIIVDNVQSSLDTILKTLGYYVTVDEDGNVTAIGSPSEPKSNLIKVFSIKFNGNSSVFENMVDGEKWKSYVSSGLENISYNNKDNKKASEIYNKIIGFWGTSFFNAAAQKIIETARNSNKNNIDCNSKEYKDKLIKLTYLLKQAQREYQIAVINLSKYDNSENRQAVSRTGKAVDDASAEYNKWATLCKS